MVRQERGTRIGDTTLAKKIWQEIQKRPELHDKFAFGIPYKRRLLCRPRRDGLVDIYFRTEEGVTCLKLNVKSDQPIKLTHQIIEHLLNNQPSLKQVIQFYVAIQTVIGSLKDVPHAWAGTDGIAEIVAIEYRNLVAELHKVPMHIFVTEIIWVICELFSVVQDLNNQFENNKDPLLSGIVHAVSSPISTILHGFFWRDRQGPNAHDSAYRSFVSGSLGVFDLFEKLILYTNGDEAFSGDLSQIIRIVSRDNIMIDSNVVTGLNPSVDPKTKLEIYLVIQELIHNAIKYSTQTGPLTKERTIQVRETIITTGSKQWVLTVSNMSSAGVDLLDQDRLFLPGIRDNQQAQIHGTGYGLFMVKTLVEKLGGTIRFVQPLPGFATTIELTLPAELFNLQNSPPSSPAAPANLA